MRFSPGSQRRAARNVFALLAAASAAALANGCGTSTSKVATSSASSTSGATSTSSGSTGSTTTGTSTSSTTSSSGVATSTTSGSGTGSSSSGGDPDAAIANPCNLPGSIQFTSSGTVTVPGGQAGADLSFLHLPVGFCAHYYATVGNVRQMRFAPGGELFVASPTTGTTSNGSNGQGAILVLPDDNLDGVGDMPITFLSGLASTQGLLFANQTFYYQDHTQIMKVPYAVGQRAPSGTPTVAVDITYYSDGLHWPKTLDVADDGTIYVGNGGSQGDSCIQPPPTKGAVLKMDGTDGGTPVAVGFRNPIAIRCARGHNQCFALELAKDYTAGQGGREKLVPIHAGDNWGFPCCATQNTPYTNTVTQNNATPDCSGVVAEGNGFIIGDTPFGLDFEGGSWPAPYTGSVFVATHGAAGTWTGTRVVAIPMDPTTGLPKPSSNTGGTNVGMTDFATGWDDNSHSHGRATAVTFSPDGRMFIANDTTGVIFWVAAM